MVEFPQASMPCCATVQAGRLGVQRMPSARGRFSPVMADDDNVSVATSSRSRKSSVVSGAPVVSGGRIFTVVKRCPLCMLRNCDPNVIPSGPQGIELHPFLIWHRGSQGYPRGRFDKICIGVWTEGGFDQEHSSPDEFIEKRKTDPQLQAEFEAARSFRVAHRCGGFGG